MLSPLPVHWQNASMEEVTTDELAARLGHNIRTLREARGLTQQQMAKVSGLPRATWANLESGAANPTLGVLHKVSAN